MGQARWSADSYSERVSSLCTVPGLLIEGQVRQWSADSYSERVSSLYAVLGLWTGQVVS